MKRKFKLGSKVRILWDKTPYSYNPDHKDTGEIRGYLTAPDDTPLVEVICTFHKSDKYFFLHFPIHAVLPLEVDIKDGDSL